MISTAEQGTTDDQLFRAVGEFFVVFSHLVSITEHLTAALISKDGDRDAYKRALIAVSNLTAHPLSNVFFSVLQEFKTPNWTENDLAILKRSRTEFSSLVEQRNRFAHDVWHLGHPNLPRPGSDSWHRIRTVGKQTAGLLVELDVVTIDTIRSLIDQTKRIDTNIRMLSLAGICGDTSRPELHLKIIVTESGEKLVACVRSSVDG